MNTKTPSKSNYFLSDISVYDMVDGRLQSEGLEDCELAQAVASSESPQIRRDTSGVGLGIPVFHDACLKSVVTLCGKTTAGSSGVFEIWEPDGPYQDLKLRSGYFGHLERFQNVSSFVRFEPGTGLPGQAAAEARAIVHDNLRNHPGFLRAAGASAGELQTAIALPIFAPDFRATVVLISSQVSPLAKCLEVWEPARGQAADGEFELAQVAFSDLRDNPETRFSAGARLTASDALIDKVLTRQSAHVFTDLGQLDSDRVAISDRCLAIPTFQGISLRSITLLWL